MTQLYTEIRLTAIALTLLLIVGWFTAGKPWHSKHTTDKKVVQIAERLDGQVERGRYIRVTSESLAETDAWGQPIQVEYREEGLSENLIVSSAGADKQFGTEDDVIVKRCC